MRVPHATGRADARRVHFDVKGAAPVGLAGQGKVGVPAVLPAEDQGAGQSFFGLGVVDGRVEAVVRVGPQRAHDGGLGPGGGFNLLGNSIMMGKRGFLGGWGMNEKLSRRMKCCSLTRSLANTRSS